MAITANLPQHGARLTARRWHRALVALAMLVAGALAMPVAHAELYGYIDEQGVAHFADSKLDDRYMLFLRDGPGHAGGGAVALRGSRASGRAGALAAGAAEPADPADPDGLRKHKLYRYIVDHPHIARVEPMIRQIALAQDVDPALVKAVMAVESGFNASAVSPKGAIGLMQVIPDTGARFGVSGDARRSIEQKLADPRVNISAGVRYLRWLMAQFPDDLELVLAAYNAGEGAVQRYDNRIPPYPETRQYVRTVMQFYRFYQPEGGRTAQVGRSARVSDVRGGSGQGQRVKVVIGGRRNMP